MLELANYEGGQFSTKVSPLTFEIMLIKTVIPALTNQSINGNIYRNLEQKKKKKSQHNSHLGSLLQVEGGSLICCVSLKSILELKDNNRVDSMAAYSAILVKTLTGSFPLLYSKWLQMNTVQNLHV